MLELSVEQKAAEWFKEEVGIPEGAGVRILVKVYGHSPISEGFSLAIETNYPSSPSVTYTSNNDILFYIEEKDEWFFEEHDLKVAYDDQLKEPKYIFIKDGVAIND